MIIGITGNMTAGKSTAGKMLHKHFLHMNKSTRILPFAEPLKEYAQSLGWDGKKDKKGRKLLQLLGTDCGRQCIDNDIWVNKWIDAAKICLSVDYDNIVADDVRFNNEAKAIKDAGGIVIKIIRPAGLYCSLKRFLSQRHTSEQGVDPAMVDYIVKNKEDFLDLMRLELVNIIDKETK